MDVTLYPSQYDRKATEPKIIMSIADLLQRGECFKVSADKPMSGWDPQDRATDDRNMRVSEIIVLSNGHGEFKRIEGAMFVVDPNQNCHYEARNGEMKFRKWPGLLHYRHSDKTFGHPTYKLEHTIEELITHMKEIGYSFP